MNVDFSNFPLLSTDRLNLRQLVIEDAQKIHQLRSDPEVNKYLDRDLSTGIEDAKAFIQKIGIFVQNNKSAYWAITLKKTGEFVGTICLYNLDLKKDTIEIGYELLPVYQGKGFTGEAIEAVIKFGFKNLGAKKITAFPSIENTASVKLLERMGFKLVYDDFANSHTIDKLLTYVLENTGN